MKTLFKAKNEALPKSLLRDDFIVPPFSILDAKSQYWMDRKHEWEKILRDRESNIRDEVASGNTAYCNDFSDEKWHGLERNGKISTFDPFLTEILVKWFSRKGDWVIDPFAGGVVRGAVCQLLGRQYNGIDISKVQIKHNNDQWNRIAKEVGRIDYPVYHLGDAESALDNIRDNCFDFLLTCPPYYNLEKYTDKAEDLSNMKSYWEFIEKFNTIIRKCYEKMKPNTFACIVVEEIRGQNGIMYGFVPDVIRIFQGVGFKYYNEMILENRVVSLKVRCPKYFNQSRKVGRHHQNILVFYKGEPREIEHKFGKFEEVDR